MLLAFTLLFLFGFLLYVEMHFLKKNVKKLKIRILVNGTRGKSSVTEYIAAGLRNVSGNTIAKITGVRPTIIYTDEKQELIKRKGPARVQEQTKIIRLAAKNSADVMVLECMSINPELQKLESRIFKPHVYVVTNIREDHREHMGKTIEEEVRSICSAIPRDSVIVSGEEKYLKEIQSFAESRNSRVVLPKRYANLNFDGLPPGVFISNVTIAVTVCEIMGVDPDKSLASISDYISRKDLSLQEINIPQRGVKFLNGFDVNDVPSAIAFLKYWLKIIGEEPELIIIFNTRADRPYRSLDFAKWLATLENVKYIILTGDHFHFTSRMLILNGFRAERIISWNKADIKNIKNSLIQIASSGEIVVGMANIAGDGFRILQSINEINKMAM
jgi:poly-gamma-glutamate synthase PgsB/CapB